MEDWEKEVLEEAKLGLFREHPLAQWHPEYFVLWNRHSMKSHEPLEIIRIGKTRMVSWDGKPPLPRGITQTIYFRSSRRYAYIRGTRYTYFIERGELVLPAKPLPGQLEPDVLAEIVLTYRPPDDRTPDTLVEEIMRYSITMGTLKSRTR